MNLEYETETLKRKVEQFTLDYSDDLVITVFRTVIHFLWERYNTLVAKLHYDFNH